MLGVQVSSPAPNIRLAVITCFCYHLAVITVQWPGRNASAVEVWRVLDLSGMTNNVRESRNFTKSGYVFLDGNRVGMRTKVPVGSTFSLELRFPSKKVVQRDIMVVHRMYYPGLNPREQGDSERKYKG